MPKITARNTRTIEPGEALQVYCASPSQVEVSGGISSLALTSSTGAVATRTDTAAATFASEMNDMLFTSTGGTTVTITVLPVTVSANASLSMEIV